MWCSERGELVPNHWVKIVTGADDIQTDTSSTAGMAQDVARWKGVMKHPPETGLLALGMFYAKAAVTPYGETTCSVWFFA